MTCDELMHLLFKKYATLGYLFSRGHNWSSKLCEVKRIEGLIDVKKYKERKSNA
jgi:hypothetical protein